MLRQSPEMCGEEPVDHTEYVRALFATKSAAELSEGAPRLDKLEQEVSQLRAQCADLKNSITDAEKSIDGWFRRHLSDLADHAAKEFVQRRDLEIMLTALEKTELHKHIRQAVEATFERESQEFGKSVFEAIRNTIQPYCFKQR